MHKNKATADSPPSATQLPVLSLRIADFCHATGIGRTSTFEMIKDGRLRSVMIAGRRLIPIGEAERLINEAFDAQHRL
jgi:hypothetical protein